MTTKSDSPLASASYKADPYPYYAQLRAETPVHKTVLPNGVEVYLVSRYEDVLAGLKDSRLVKDIRNARPTNIIQAPLLAVNSSNMLRADPPAHDRLRKLANEAFRPKYINQMREHIEQIATTLIDKVEADGQMDLIADFAFPLPITVISEMFSVPERDHIQFSQWSKTLIDSGALSNEGAMAQPAIMQLAGYVRTLIHDHHQHPKGDLINQLIDAEENGDKLSDLELIGTTILLLIAGHETTVNLIGNGMLALLQAPDQLEKLKQDPSLIRPAVEELLRFVNPVQLVNRYAAVDMEIAGTPIPRGSHLLLLIGAANHDSAHFANADSLNISSDEAKHVAFSQGIHYCLGAPLARLEGEIAFRTLLTRLPNIRLAAPAAEINWRPAIELRGLASLPVVF